MIKMFFRKIVTLSFQSFTNDVIAHQADLRFITMAAQKFINESQVNS